LVLEFNAKKRPYTCDLSCCDVDGSFNRGRF